MEESLATQIDSSTPNILSSIAQLSDRAIQRIVGNNAYLRGRIYARRRSVEDLESNPAHVSAKVVVRNDEPYQVELKLDDAGTIVSHCTCSAWRGPQNPCKHVAAVLITTRDRERPAKAKQDDTELELTNGATNGAANGASLAPVVGAAANATALAGGKRRRSRRKRKGTQTNGAGAQGQLNVLSLRDTNGDARGSQPVWLSSDEATQKPFDFEFRLVVRTASIVVTPVIAGTRSVLPINDALAGFNTLSVQQRPLFRLLSRHVVRGQASSAELRAEDAAEALSLLRDKRVLIEPASMELRFSDEALRPKLEIDSAQGTNQGVRVRVVFENKQGNRRFALSNGAWFEGTPSWYVDVNEGVARPVVDQVTPAWLQRLYRSPSVVYSAAELPRLLTEFLPRVSTSLGAELPDLSSAVEVIDLTPRIQMRVDGDIIEARARIVAVYDDLSLDVNAGAIPAPLAFKSLEGARGKPTVIRRDVGVELGAVQILMEQGFTAQEDGSLHIKGDQAIAFWTKGIADIPKEWERFIPDDLVNVSVRNKPVIPQMRVSSGVDWLDLQMSFDSGGVAVSEDELRACLSQGRHLVKLQDGSYAPVATEQVREILDRLSEMYVAQGKGGKLPLSQAGRVKDLMKLVATQSVSDDTQQLFGKLEDIGQVESIPKPRNLKATLRPYQQQGFSWLVFLRNIHAGGILADDMGLGKTVQTIALLLWAKTKSKKSINLVVAPTSVVPNWKREIEKFAPTLSALVWQGPDRHQHAQKAADVDVIITSYALLRRDEEFLQSLELNYAILDEAQHIKNPLSATARAAKRLNAEHRLALSGTPIENRLSEIWSIFDFVSPGLLGSLPEFEEKYARPVERGDVQAISRLRSTIHPFVMRRTKSEVAKDLPEKIEQEIIVPLAEQQAKLYEQILRQVRESVLSEIDKQGVASSQIQILAALTRLRQVACDPRLLKIEGNFDDDESGKLNALKEILQEAVAGGHRVLVFSQFVEMLKLIREALEGDKISYLYLDGSTKDRQALVDRFNVDEGVSVFLISLKAGGTGLNLTGADTVVHFDPWWNPAVEDQATDRAHRIGQQKVVTVYRLVAKGTVEEKILKLSGKKRELMSNVLSAEGSPLKGLSRDDVVDLFSEPENGS